MSTQNIHRLRLALPVAQKLEQLHLCPGKRVEAITVLNGHAHQAADGAITVVVAKPDQVIAFDRAAYVRQAFAAAQLRKEVRGQAYYQALQDGYNASIDAHDHHMVHDAHFSGTDDKDDLATARYFGTTVPHFAPRGPDGGAMPVFSLALVLAKAEWAARILHAPGQALFGTPMRIDVVGPKATTRSRLALGQAAAQHVRQAPVLGGHGQGLMGQLHVVVVGAGGTGSIAAELLARKGVRRLTLVDQDAVELSNLNRLQGVGPGQEGLRKVSALRTHLARCCPEVDVRIVDEPIWSPAGVAAAECADVLLGCVDNNETRWFLNRLAVQYLLPYWDVGVRVQTSPLQLFARCTAVFPGAGPCGHCSPITYFPRKRPASFLDAATLAAQRQAGYVSNNDAMASDPSLYALNMQAVAQFGQEFARWLSPQGVVSHSHLQFNRPDGGAAVQRLGSDAVASAPDPDCPVCGSLLGACRSQLLPQLNPPAPELDLSEFLSH